MSRYSTGNGCTSTPANSRRDIGPAPRVMTMTEYYEARFPHYRVALRVHKHMEKRLAK